MNLRPSKQQQGQHDQAPLGDRRDRILATRGEDGIVHPGTLVDTVRHAVTVGVGVVIPAAAADAGLNLVRVVRAFVAFIPQTVTVSVRDVARGIGAEEDPPGIRALGFPHDRASRTDTASAGFKLAVLVTPVTGLSIPVVALLASINDAVSA